jgi:prepilin-type N-terminal cleavage/methylation domain-containing protein
LRKSGFTLIELLVVICVVALLFAVALDRLMRLQEAGERSVMEQNIAAMNVALNMKFAALIVAGRPEAIQKEAGTNPVELLARPPENYLGALYAPLPGSLAPRSWYYDRATGDLVYVPGRTRYLTEPPDAEQGLHFRIVLSELSPRHEPGVTELPVPMVMPMQAYRWSFE